MPFPARPAHQDRMQPTCPACGAARRRRCWLCKDCWLALPVALRAGLLAQFFRPLQNPARLAEVVALLRGGADDKAAACRRLGD